MATKFVVDIVDDVALRVAAVVVNVVHVNGGDY